ncbi:MAG: TIGR02099 family protein [Gammaproteobacteria bacterium]|nr:TIGR02099 family protein [Gammaproteobacteria bacterium]
MNAYIASITRKVGIALSAIFIFIALILLTGIFITPFLNKHKDEFSVWAGEMLQTPVTVNQAAFSWYHFHPGVALKGVTLLSKETNAPILQIRTVRIYFSLLKSLWHFQPVLSGIVVAGTEVNITEDQKGEIALKGFPAITGFNDQPDTEPTKALQVVGFLFTQPYLTLQDTDVRFVSKTGKKLFVTLYRLNLKNSNDNHRITGDAILHQAVPTKINTVINFQGHELDPKHVNAHVYLNVSGLSLSQWFTDWQWQGFQIRSGVGSIKVWATLQMGTLTKLQTIAQLYHVKLYANRNKMLYPINRLSGNFGYEKQDNIYKISGDDVLIDLAQSLWPVTSFNVVLEKNANEVFTPKLINFGYLNLKDVQQLLLNSSLLTNEDHIRLAKLNLSGDLQDTSIVIAGPWEVSSNLKFATRFNKIYFSAQDVLPGLKNLTGKVDWDGSIGHVTLRSNRLVLDYPKALLAPVTIDELAGEALVKGTNKNWSIDLQHFQILNNEMALNLAGMMTLVENVAPTVDLSANFTMQKMPIITRYLPLRFFDASLTTWLKTALKSGELKAANIVLRGSLKDFPFTNGKGVFAVTGEFEKVDLNYAQSWPTLKNMAGKINFNGSQMTVVADEALLAGVPFTNIVANIPNLMADKVVVNLSHDPIQTDFTHVFAFINSSPLQATLGKITKTVDILGRLGLTTKLTIPLSELDAIKVQGDAGFNDVELKVIGSDLAINQLRGQLKFTESSVTAKNILGILNNQPVSLNLNTLTKPGNKQTIQATLNNKMTVAEIEQWLKMSIATFAEGRINLTTQINIDTDSPLTVDLSSDLVGLKIDLPEQFAKKAEETRAFKAEIIFADANLLRIKLRYGSVLGAALILHKKNDAFDLQSVNLRLGEGEASWPENPGLYITGHLKLLDWSQVSTYLGQAKTESINALKLQGIEISADTVMLGQLRLSNLNVHGFPEKDYWNINVRSPDVVGDLEVPQVINREKQIKARFGRLYLHATPNIGAGMSLSPETLPPISFIADHVRYDDMNLGQVIFNATPIAEGLSVRTLQLSSNFFNLRANGTWLKNITHLQGEGVSSNVSNLLKSLNFDTHNFVSSKGQIQFNLQWEGSPFAPSLSTLGGKANLDLGPGRIVEIEGTSGAKMDFARLLSVFSLQALPRRLSLDFSDVFNKGYSFDYIRGDFNLKNGNALTNNMRIEGPIARVEIRGRIGFSRKDLDLTVKAIPYVSSSLPVAAALIATPIAGLAAFAVERVIGSQVSRVTTLQYEVKGPWTNPDFKPVSN